MLYCTLFVPQTSCHLFQLICPPMLSRETRNNDVVSKPLGSPNGPGYYPHEKSLFWTGEEIAGSATTGSATTGSTSSPEVELSPRCLADTESVVQGVKDGEEWARRSRHLCDISVFVTCYLAYIIHNGGSVCSPLYGGGGGAEGDTFPYKIDNLKHHTCMNLSILTGQ